MTALLLALLLAQPIAPTIGPMPPPLLFRSPEWVQPGSGSRAPFINVKAAPYFADSTGATDITATVAAAYAATASGGAFPGACLYFPSGTYKYNLTIDRSGVCINGGGRAFASTPSQGGTVFKPADLTLPVLQVGDGIADVENTTLGGFSIIGDGTFLVAGTTTSDGLVLLGARNTFVSNFEIHGIGGDSIRVTSSATRASVYTQMERFTINNYGVRGINVTYGPSFTVVNNFSHYNISPNNVVDTARGMYIEGAEVNSVTGWIQAQNGYKNVYLRYDSQTNTNAPKLNGANTTTIDSPLNTDVLVNLDMVGTAFNHRLSTQHLNGVSIDGQIKWDVDATVVSMKGTYPNRITGNLEVLGGLGFNAGLNDSRDEQSSPTTRLLQGNGGAGNETLDLTGAAFKIPGTFNKGIAFANTGHLWKGVGGMLRYANNLTPGSDTAGIAIYSTKQAISHTGTGALTIDMSLGTWVVLTVTDIGSNFTVNALSGVSSATNQRATFTVSNTSAGALGTITWPAAFKMVAFTNPATGKQTSFDVIYDGTNWIQITPQTADVSN